MKGNLTKGAYPLLAILLMLPACYLCAQVQRGECPFYEQFRTLSHHVIIYGWHRPDGTPIQPVYDGHVNTYVDYSHGVRLISNKVLVDGKEHRLQELIEDPVLWALICGD